MDVETFIHNVIRLNADEFATLQNINLNVVTLRLKFDRGRSPIERGILLDQTIHFVCPDLVEYMIRSTLPRIEYQAYDLPARHFTGKYFEKGDVVILN